MKLSTKGRYAVTAMLDLALHATDNPVNLAEISERQNISVSYLEQLFAKLRKHGLVDSVRGPGGGYRLKNGPETVRVSDIIIAKEVELDVPLVVRLEGTNVEKGKEILANSGLPIVPADDLGDAAKKIVAEVKQAA